MFLKVMMLDGRTISVDRFSKCMQIKDLRRRISEILEASEDRLRLFFRGKQLENGYTVFDYDVNINDVIQCMVKPIIESNDDKKGKESKKGSPRKSKESPMKMVGMKDEDDAKESSQSSSSQEEPQPGPSTSEQQNEDCEKIGRAVENMEPFQVGDVVEMIDESLGAWFTVILRNIYFDTDIKEYVFIGEYKGFDSKNTKKVDITEISATKEFVRFPVQNRVQLKDIKVGDVVKVMYSIDNADKKGLWYDCVVRTVKLGSRRQFKGDIIVGRSKDTIQNCVITATSNMFRVSGSGSSASNHIECEHCMDKPQRKCKECACRVCGGKDEPDKQIMCDECDYAYHIWCLKPKLETVPDTDDWYCPDCKNDENEIIKAGEKLKITKKKSKLASYKTPQAEGEAKGRDWGQGMACAGRTKDCTIVPPNHFGPIPGVEVGSSWLYRVQVAESGVHRPHVSGIHGRQEEGAYSIILSGGYEDDKDEGDSFMYTGCGGRDLSGNKRTSIQSSDQKLEHLNLALARNCNAPINKEVGATSKDWRKGKPVRVIRNYKAYKHSKYAPKEGNRYDGIYKIVKYFPMKGKSGFIVWRYQLQRDDPVPAPWTKAGKERIEALGLEMQVPEGYDEKLKEKQEKAKNVKDKKNEEKAKKATGGKRSLKQTVLKELLESKPSPPKKMKVKYEVEKDVALLIKKDGANSKLWSTCKDATQYGKQQFLKEVQTVFNCICCQELVYKPVTTSCKHNFCKVCLDRAFAADVKTCPHCRYDLSSEKKFTVNVNLQNVLLALFPGYTGGR